MKYEVEGLYYLCSKNKGADQLRVYREPDLRLFLRTKNVGFLMTFSIYVFSSVGLFVSYLVRNPEDRFPHDMTQNLFKVYFGLCFYPLMPSYTRNKNRMFVLALLYLPFFQYTYTAIQTWTSFAGHHLRRRTRKDLGSL